MPFKLPFGAGAPSNKPKEPSLDEILPTKALRVELVVLLALCTDAMRDALNNTFAKTTDPTKEYSAALNRTDLWGSGAAESALQDAALQYFNEWRTRVLRKTGETLDIQSGDVKRRKDHYQSTVRTSNTTMLDSESRDTWLPFRSIPAPAALIQELDDSKRALVLSACFFILLSLETYPAHSRVLLMFLCESLQLPNDVLSSAEASTAITLLKTADASSIDAASQTDEARLAQAEKGRQGRKWKVGLATVAGAVAIGITGGLAAPVILGLGGALLGGVGLGSLATLLGATIANPVTIAALFGALGGRMTGRAMDSYAGEVEDFRFMPTKSKPTEKEREHKLRVAIGISGWVQEENDVVQPWKVFSDAALEPFGLRYELAALTDLTQMLDTLLKDTAYSMAQAGAVRLLLPVLAAAMLPLTLMKAGKLLDNPFTIAMERSDKAGKVLAHALIARVQGERPVTLVGFSLGARVIAACLQELAQQKAFGLVENAVMIGAPVPSDASTWRVLRAVVVGRLVNVYASKDFLLGYLYRARNATMNISGLQPISDVAGVESADVSQIVTGHNQYKLAMGKILKQIHFNDLDMDRIEDEELELEAEQLREQAIHDEAKRSGQLEGEEDDDGQLVMADVSKMDSGREKPKVSSTMRDLRGLDLSDTSLDKANEQPPQELEGSEVTRSTPDSITTRQSIPQSGSRASRSGRTDETMSHQEDQPLTPTTSDDEEEDDSGSRIKMVDDLNELEPEAVPDTPPRPARQR